MAASVAAPLERRLGEIAGVTEITSVSSLGSSMITVQFDLSRNADGAARDVQAALNAAATDLPSDLPSLPNFRKTNPAAAPIIILALTSDTVGASAIYDAADTVLAQRLSQVEGVAEVSVNGADQPAMRIRADPQRLAAMGVSLEDIRNTITNANSLTPLGVIDSDERAHTIGANGQLTQARGFRQSDRAQLERRDGAALLGRRYPAGRAQHAFFGDVQRQALCPACRHQSRPAPT